THPSARRRAERTSETGHRDAPSFVCPGDAPMWHTPHFRRRSARFRLERLEERSLLSSYTVATVTDLIESIGDANGHPSSNTITLVPGNSFTLTTPDAANPSNGLPAITSGNSLTIQGNGDTIARSGQNKTPAFRFFDVASGASLTLTNMTLSNG